MYVFNHIPKCGGHTIIHALKTWNKEIILDYSTRPIIKEFNPNQILCGHSIVHKYPTLFNKKNIHFFSFIRDPLSLNISLYFYFRNRGQYQHISLNEYLFVVSLNVPNIIARHLKCNYSNYSQIINLYSFIGIIEYIQESFNLLCLLTDHKSLILPSLNESIKDKQEVAKEIADLFRQKNDLDYKIYLYCMKKFEKTLNSMS